MAFGRSKNSEAAQQSAERRRREDDAPRLAAIVPELGELKLEIGERRLGTTVSHVRRIVVANAPALFVLTCVHKGCEGGGHDITRELVAALKRHEKRFVGSSACQGTIGPDSCGSALEYVATATYHS
jgi:hypothetical protein